MGKIFPQMKNKFFFLCNMGLLGLSSCMLLLFACDSKGTASDQSQQDDMAVVKPFVHNLYENYIFKYGELDELKVNFNDSIMQYLRREYADEYDGDGYATWLLRTGCQDGPEDVSGVDTIIALPDSWYEVRFSDLGNKGSRRLKIVVTDSTPVIEAFE